MFVASAMWAFFAWLPISLGFAFGVWLTTNFDFEVLKFEIYFWFLMIYGAGNWLTSFLG